MQELTPGNASPDMANLRLCKESELRRGHIIGSGAFGTVYKVRHCAFSHAIFIVSSSSGSGSGGKVKFEVEVEILLPSPPLIERKYFDARLHAVTLCVCPPSRLCHL